MPITVAGTQITFNDGTNQTTAFTGSGGVTSLNGQTGAITNTGTNAIGSYIYAWVLVNGGSYGYGDTVAGSNFRVFNRGSDGDTNFGTNSSFGPLANPNCSGTWRSMAAVRNASGAEYTVYPNLWVRIS